MKTINEKITDMYRIVESCHPSRVDQIKNIKAIRILAKELDQIVFDIKLLNERYAKD